MDANWGFRDLNFTLWNSSLGGPPTACPSRDRDGIGRRDFFGTLICRCNTSEVKAIELSPCKPGLGQGDSTGQVNTIEEIKNGIYKTGC